MLGSNANVVVEAYTVPVQTERNRVECRIRNRRTCELRQSVVCMQFELHCIKERNVTMFNYRRNKNSVEFTFG